FTYQVLRVIRQLSKHHPHASGVLRNSNYLSDALYGLDAIHDHRKPQVDLSADGQWGLRFDEHATLGDVGHVLLDKLVERVEFLVYRYARLLTSTSHGYLPCRSYCST